MDSVYWASQSFCHDACAIDNVQCYYLHPIMFARRSIYNLNMRVTENVTVDKKWNE